MRARDVEKNKLYTDRKQIRACKYPQFLESMLLFFLLFFFFINSGTLNDFVTAPMSSDVLEHISYPCEGVSRLCLTLMKNYGSYWSVFNSGVKIQVFTVSKFSEQTISLHHQVISGNLTGKNYR